MDIQKYLDNFFKGTKNPSLDAMHYFMEKLGSPEKKLKFIHIAGTNGKGSCAEIMSNILINAGYKVGKFMSPHLIKYNERISINHQDITDSEMEDLLEKLKPLVDEYNASHDFHVTLFELETTMALLYFYQKKCDIVVLETGLGGLYDCTNIVNPLVSIITSIGMDHMDILGNSLEEIAEQKAGIIKENSDTIMPIQESEVNEIIEKKCLEKKNKLHWIKEEEVSNYSYNNEFQKFDYKDKKDVQINLKGKKQISNSCICLECIEVLKQKGYEIPENIWREALKSIVHKGRLEELQKNSPKIIYDGAHNEPAIKNLISSVEMYYPEKCKTYIVSILGTKDYKAVLSLLLRDNKGTFYFTSGNSDRYVPKEELLEFARSCTKNKRLYAKELKEAIGLAQKEHKNDVILIVGSFYIYGDVIKIINNM